jgi:ABC-type transport system involved in cytochrome c biogenesis permease subunit
MILGGTTSTTGVTDWENFPFILCNHEGLRAEIFKQLATSDQKLSDDQVHGKYVSPAELRASQGFDALLKSATRHRMEDPEKAHFKMPTEELKAEDVVRRLAAFDHVSGKSSTRLCTNAWADGHYVDLVELAGKGGRMGNTPEQVLAFYENNARQNPDPFHLVGLDRVPGSAWFSSGEINACLRDKEKWQDMMRERLAEMPQLYINPESLQSLRKFQDQIKAGKGQAALDKLKQILRDRRDEKIEAIKEAIKGGNQQQWQQIVANVLRVELRNARRGDKQFQAIVDAVQKASDGNDMAGLRAILRDSDDKVIKRMQQAIDLTRTHRYHPDDLEFRMLHLDFLEAMYPNVYKESLEAQSFPAEDARKVVASLGDLKEAYKSGAADQFASASQKFLRMLRDTSDWTLVRGLAERNPNSKIQQALSEVEKVRKADMPEAVDQEQQAFFQVAQNEGIDVPAYPGVSTIPLELRFNRSQPFLWAWVIMIPAVIAVLASMILDSGFLYVIGLGTYLSSLIVQSFGFYARIAISGRAPVSNMYETVIWVSFMSAIFALVLELVYRRKVILLAGSIVALFGLVLADQMPLALDPSISPLVPVLRSNYWLTIHVLTIVSSYAGGGLAWVLGNIALILFATGKGSPQLRKTLTQYTYRAIQIAVLLLAAGTFLGGWWAAVSWGRFWGWDSKEVGALIALVCYVIPLHARFIGWVKDFGLAVSAVLCFLAIMYSWYAVNFVIAAGLHSYGFGGGGYWWVFGAVLLNLEWVLVASVMHLKRTSSPTQVRTTPEPKEMVGV